ncbi:FecR family protein [Paenalcaligenes sp. Me131]|uniref:FecR family protein n=1 Tax=Paenalcaligenes sp. Me131 TaxID=3392636 RepID=UPI003D2A1862
MHTENTTTPDDIQDAAAYWFARVHSGNFTVAERERFMAWRSANPKHEQEYRALDQIWQATGMLPEDELRALLEVPESSAQKRVGRRQWLVGAGAVCAAAVVGGVAVHHYGVLDATTDVLQYATAQGEQRKVQLPDSSVIEMNVNTELTVQYYASRRVIALAQGEATFEVVSNSERPFIVDAGDTSVRVTGTVFNVRREPDRVAVAVQSGSVEVTTGRWWSRDEAMLTADMVAEVQANRSLYVERADVGVLTAWRQGKVVFRDQPLDDVVREMNRYLRHPIHLTDSRLKPLRMAGVFNIQDAEGFLQALQTHLPVVVVQRPDGSVNLALLR